MGVFSIVVVLFGLVCLGWTVLLGIGIYRKRRQLRGGKVCIILGSIWAVPGLGLAGLFAYGLFMAFSYKPAEVVAFDPATYAGETGSISVNYDGAVRLEAVTQDEGVHYRMTGDAGDIIAPLGTLVPYNLELRSEGDGGVWTASSYLSHADKPILVTVDNPVPFETGIPMTATVVVNQKASRQVVLTFSLKGRNGEDFSIRSPKRRQVPRFEICDKRGEIVLSGAFSYG